MTSRAEHWAHLRNYQSIESTFATVRNRSEITKGAGFARGRNRYGLHADRGPAVTPARGQRPHLVPSSAPEPNSRTANPSNDATNQEVKIKPRNTPIHRLEISLQNHFHWPICAAPASPGLPHRELVPSFVACADARMTKAAAPQPCLSVPCQHLTRPVAYRTR
jgi:hypothetical protein